MIISFIIFCFAICFNKLPKKVIYADNIIAEALSHENIGFFHLYI